MALILVIMLHVERYLVESRPAVGGGGFLQTLVERGGAGLLIFFALSGFLLGLPFARAAAGSGRPVSLRQYMKRRLTRVAPPYVVSMTLLFVALIAFRGANLFDVLPDFLASLGYVHNVIFNNWSLINAPAWSLEVEVQFYLLAPVIGLVYLMARRSVRLGLLIAAGSAVGVVQLAVLRDMAWRADLTLVGNLQYFLAGMLVADLVALPGAGSGREATRRWLGGTAWLWDVAAVCGFAVVMVSEGYPVARAMLLPYGAVACLMGALRGTVVPKLLSRPWMHTIGSMSYSAYLLHVAVISLVGTSSVRLAVGDAFLPNLALQVVVLGVLIAAVSAAFFMAVERPCMDPDWPTKLRARLSRSAPRRLEPATVLDPAAQRGEPIIDIMTAGAAPVGVTAGRVLERAVPMEARGRTAAEARGRALDLLGVDDDDADVEIFRNGVSPRGQRFMARARVRPGA